MFNKVGEASPAHRKKIKSYDTRSEKSGLTWWTVFAHQGEPPAKACRSWTFADDSTAEDIEDILKELSEYIEHEV